MSRAALVLALVLAAPAHAAAFSATRAGLTVWPARTRIAAGQTATMHVANGSGRVQVLTLSVAGFALDLRGDPRVVRASAGTRLLRVRPATLVVAPHAAAWFTVRALPAAAAPGDHPALVLLTARSGGGAGIGVRLRIGVSIEVRVPGMVRHRLELVAARLRMRRLVDVVVENRGNVSERIGRGALVARVWLRHRLVVTLAPRPRELLPRTRGVVEFALPRRLHGRLTIVAAAPRGRGRGRARRLSVTV